MKKKLLSVLVALCLCLCLLPGAVVADSAPHSTSTSSSSPSSTTPPSTPVVATYRIIVEDSSNGTVAPNRKYAAAGQTVTLTVTPDTGCTLTSLTVTNARGTEVTLNDLGDGEYTFRMPASRVTVKAVFGAGSFYDDAVNWAEENGIDVDDPDSTCSRTGAIVLLWQAAGCPESTSTDMPFTDVLAGADYYKALLWAAENGITIGTSKTTFSPELGCTRAQIVTLLWRVAGKPAAEGITETFRDVPEDAWYTQAVYWAVEQGIITGTDSGVFSPDAYCTCGQIITMLYRQVAN